MKNQKKVVWYRFKTRSVDDYRPLIDMKDIGMPWWCTGWASDGSYAVIVCYLPDGEALSKYWNDAFDIQMEYRDEIVYTERLQKPEYLSEIGESTTGVREMYLRHCPFCHARLKQRFYLNIMCNCGAKYYYNAQTWIKRNCGVGVNECCDVENRCDNDQADNVRVGAELIALNDAIEILNSEGITKNMRVHRKIASLPAVSAPEVVRGVWIWDEDSECYVCSRCGLSALNDYRGNSVASEYCSHCGAEMKGDNVRV